MDAVHRASAAGIPVLNPPRAIETAVDKYLSLSRLELAGVSVPHTWVGESAECAREVFERLGRDIVIKPIFGSEGCGMTRVSDPDLAGRAFRALERLNQVIYAQAYLSHKGYDVRVLVLGDRVLGAIKRVATDGEWRTNVARGGKAAAWIPPDEVVELALAAARATGAIFAGVDLLPTRDHAWVVLEVNAVPGWRALAAVTGLDVAREVLAHLRAMG
jgi:ribosomal protein S6--L-glutamate ligase